MLAVKVVTMLSILKSLNTLCLLYLKTKKSSFKLWKSLFHLFPEGIARRARTR